jgi:hypothetical protein
MPGPSGMRQPRGVARQVIFVVQYPNGDIRTFPINAAAVHEIIVNTEDAERRLGDDPALYAQWNTGDWRTNPSVLLQVEAGPTARPYVPYGRYTGHEPPRPTLGGPAAGVDGLALNQQRRNLFTRTFWDDYAGYRQKLMGLVEGKRGRVCVLGAGNCNDIDLQCLARLFDQITLVDIDPQAVEAAVARQGPLPNIRIIPLEVSGVLPVLSSDLPGKCGLAVECFQQRRATGRCPDLGTFDVVLSSCLLTQLIFNARLAVAADDPAFARLLDALRLDHVHLMCDLLTPGGLGILATDVVSTDLAPYLPSIPESLFEEAVTRLIDLGICMAGAHPWQIRRLIEGDDGLTRQLHRVRTLGPWRWTMRADLVYGVYTHLLHKDAR